MHAQQSCEMLIWNEFILGSSRSYVVRGDPTGQKEVFPGSAKFPLQRKPKCLASFNIDVMAWKIIHCWTDPCIHYSGLQKLEETGFPRLGRASEHDVTIPLHTGQSLKSCLLCFCASCLDFLRCTNGVSWSSPNLSV